MENRFYQAMKGIEATQAQKQAVHALYQTLLKDTKQQELRLQAKTKRRTLRGYAVAVCAALVLVAGGVGGYGVYAAPVSYIGVELNPSLELALNCFDRVVKVEAYNSDAQAILADLPLKNRYYTDAIEVLLSDAQFQQYRDDEKALTFTVVSDQEEKLLQGIQHCQGYGAYQAQCHSASSEALTQAHHSGIPLGKYQLYLELLAYEETLTPEDCAKLSARELRERLAAYQGESVTTQAGCGQGCGQKRGGGHCAHCDHDS